MGMKDKFQEQAEQLKRQAKEKTGRGREKTGERSSSQERPPHERGRHEDMRDVEESEQSMQDRFDQDYDV